MRTASIARAARSCWSSMPIAPRSARSLGVGEVVAGAERLARTGEDDDPAVVLVVEVDRHPLELVEHRVRHRVVPVGPVERHDDDAASVESPPAAAVLVVTLSRLFTAVVPPGVRSAGGAGRLLPGCDPCRRARPRPPAGAGVLAGQRAAGASTTAAVRLNLGCGRGWVMPSTSTNVPRATLCGSSPRLLEPRASPRRRPRPAARSTHSSRVRVRTASAKTFFICRPLRAVVLVGQRRRVDLEDLEQLGVEVRLHGGDGEPLAVRGLVDVVERRAASRRCWSRASVVQVPALTKPWNAAPSSAAPSTIAASTTWPRPERCASRRRPRRRARAPCRRRRSRRRGSAAGSAAGPRGRSSASTPLCAT